MKPTYTITQLKIMFLMVCGAWADRPLTSIHGNYVGYWMHITPKDWDNLHKETHAIYIAQRALKENK